MAKEKKKIESVAARTKRLQAQRRELGNAERGKKEKENPPPGDA